MFEVFEQDADLVINVINYLIAKKEKQNNETEQVQEMPLPKKDFWDYV